MRGAALALALAVSGLVVPGLARAQSAGEVERCFRNPAACGQGAGTGQGAGQAQPPAAPPVTVRPAAPAPDYATVLNSPEAERKRLQEALRTLDKYNGPIDGNLQSEGTAKGIAEWQKGRGTNPVGKLTPPEAQQLLAEATRTPIRRIEPPPQGTAQAPVPTPAPAPVPGAAAAAAKEDPLKALKARLAERRRAAEPKAEAATQALVRDLKAYVAADGKGAVGEQFADFAKWYADNKAAGRTVGEIAPAIDDYGDARGGAAVTSEIVLETKQGASDRSQCLVFAWIEGTPRKSSRVFSCDDVAGVEKWKTEQALRSAWR
ncbi:MAG: peptidoglycan-binding domain-containing protein [Reyranellaceae bacterium]